MLMFFLIVQLQILRSKFSTAKISNRNRYLHKVFTEKGLYIYHSKILKFSDSQFHIHSQFPPNAVYNFTNDNKAERRGYW